MNSLYFRTLASASALAAFALTAVAQIQPSTPPASVSYTHLTLPTSDLV